MKELSIEEKAKAYDVALELMKDCIPDENGLVHISPSDIFPELKKSEDEVVGNAIAICLACGVQHHIIDSDMNVRCLAWLEKQGEQKLAEWTAEDEEELKIALNTLEEAGQYSSAKWLKKFALFHRQCRKPAETVKWSPLEESCICQLESLVKEKWCLAETVHNSEKIKKMSGLMFFLKTLNPNKKPADKVEPKFKIEKDKWYICISQYCNCIEGRVYKATSDSRIMDDFGTEYDMQSDAYKYFHIWTIKDAKDGDVLVASDGSIFLFAGVVDCACKYYAALTPDNYFKVNKEAKGGYWETSRAVHPATKAQRDTLEKAMTDAGYTFDFEKKELKNIYQQLKKLMEE